MIDPVIKNEFRNRLHEQFIAVLSTVNAMGKPESAVLYYWADGPEDEIRLFFATRRDSRKFQNLMERDSVAMLVGTGFEPDSIQIQGRAELLKTIDGAPLLAEFSRMLDAKPNVELLYRGAYLPQNPFGRIEGEEFGVFRVIPDFVRWMRLNPETNKVEDHQVI